MLPFLSAATEIFTRIKSSSINFLKKAKTKEKNKHNYILMNISIIIFYTFNR